MKIVRTPAALAVVVLSLAVGLTGCGKNTVSSQIPAGSGTLIVKVTDDPVDLTQISHLFVTFDRLYLFPQRAADDSSGADHPQPIEIITTPTTLDLVTLSNGLTAALGSANVPEGSYRSVNLVVSSSWLITTSGDTADVRIPSGSTRGLKIVTDFTVSAGGVSEITLDFNAAASLHEEPPGSGHYVLRPVIRQLPEDHLAASISGHVFVQTDAGLISAGDYLVPNPRKNHHGHDFGDDHGGHGNRHGDDRRPGGPPDSMLDRPLIPLTIAWPMIVGARPDSAADDSANVETSLATQNDDHQDGENDGRDHPNRPHHGATIVNREGEYRLWRLRRDLTFHLALHLFPRSGFEVISGPGPLVLTGDLTGQDFVIRKVPTP